MTAGFFILLFVVLSIYLLPWLTAVFRGHNMTTPIAVVNIFLGWTFLAWVICLAWSLSPNVRDSELPSL
jgi:hypothetical protein